MRNWRIFQFLALVQNPLVSKEQALSTLSRWKFCVASWKLSDEKAILNSTSYLCSPVTLIWKIWIHKGATLPPFVPLCSNPTQMTKCATRRIHPTAKQNISTFVRNHINPFSADLALSSSIKLKILPFNYATTARTIKNIRVRYLWRRSRMSQCCLDEK